MVRDDIGPDGTGRGRDGMGRYDAKRQGKYRKGEIKLFQAAVGDRGGGGAEQIQARVPSEKRTKQYKTHTYQVRQEQV